MRIIAGTARSLPLRCPEGMDTRPTSDQIKETLFNIINDEVLGSNFLDLFAGSGQIGIEALSRYAASVTFVDNNRAAIDCIKSNLDKCHIDTDAGSSHISLDSDDSPADAKASVICSDCLMQLKHLKKERFDIVFMDPPYGKGLEKEILTFLADSDILTDNALIIAEADLYTDFEYVSKLGYGIIQDKKYKTNRHLLLRKINT